MDSCYSHAVLDNVFPLYWIIDDLILNNEIEKNKFRIFVKSWNFDEIQTKESAIIDEKNSTFKGAWKNIIELVTDKPLIFERFIKKDFFFKKCIICSNWYSWQRTPWNCLDYYPGRNIEKKDVIFSDEIIYYKLKKFKRHVFKKNNISNNSLLSNDMIIIDRKYNRKIDNNMLENLKTEASKNTNWNFKGVVILEDLTFYEQVKLFNETRFFISRHGSSLLNLLWIKNNSVWFELNGGSDGFNASPWVCKRLCDLSESKQVFLEYNNYNAKTDIFDTIIKFKK
jgi:hypothetical protein